MNYVQRPIRFWAPGLWGDPKSRPGSAIFEQTIIGRSYLSICLILDSFNGGTNKLKSVLSLGTDDHQTDFTILRSGKLRLGPDLFVRYTSTLNLKS